MSRDQMEQSLKQVRKLNRVLREIERGTLYAWTYDGDDAVAVQRTPRSRVRVYRISDVANV